VIEMKKKKYDIKIEIPKVYSQSFKNHSLIAFYDKEENRGLLAWSPEEPSNTKSGEIIVHHLVAYLSMLSLIPEETYNDKLRFPNSWFRALAFFVLQWERKDFNPSKRETKWKTNLEPIYEKQLVSIVEESLKKWPLRKKVDIL